jgi:hypothetical protein
MGTFAETAIVLYRYSFADQGKKCPFSVFVCSKQTEVAVSVSPCSNQKEIAVLHQFRFPYIFIFTISYI